MDQYLKNLQEQDEKEALEALDPVTNQTTGSLKSKEEVKEKKIEPQEEKIYKKYLFITSRVHPGES